MSYSLWGGLNTAITAGGQPDMDLRKLAVNPDIGAFLFHVTPSAYEYIIKDRPHLSKLKWVHMIVDEGHHMKNTQSKLSQTLTTYYHSRYRLILMGTPLQNNLPEVWSLLNFVLQNDEPFEVKEVDESMEGMESESDQLQFK
jgi:SNF2 family DNA or RNA helicase